MKGRLLVLSLIIALIIIFPTFSEQVDLDEKIVRELSSHEEVSVVIKYKEEPKEPNVLKTLFVDEIDQEKVIDEFYAAEITQEELTDLLNDDNIETITLDEVANIYLDDSSIIQNASTVNTKQYSSTNLTGLGYSVCVIDSGVNSTHPALKGRVIAEYCYCSLNEYAAGSCCNDGTDEDNDAEDNNGHGTHVAGIIASNDTTYTGIAPQANIVAVKVTNSTGSAAYSDITSAISWCNSNKDTYNITAISISIGGGAYSSHCDAIFSAVGTTQAVNAAHSNNISVVMSTGNYYLSNPGYIGGPACIKNVIAVSSVTKSDTVSSFADRNSITDMFAIGGTSPGSAACPNSNYICSADYDGTFIGYSGTSMATPQVSGAIAILQQYKEQVEGQVLTADQVNATITQNGPIIDDSGASGYTFFRLDVLASLLAIDNLQPSIIAPNITQNLYYYQNATITVNVTDVNLDTVYVEGNWTGTKINYTLTQDGDKFNYTIDSNNFTTGQVFSWRIYANDSAGNLNTSNLFTSIADAGGPQITLNEPENNSIINTQTITFNFTGNDEQDLEFNCTLLINGVYNLSNLTVLNNNLTNFNINLTDNTYTWNVLCLDSGNNSVISETRSVTIDTLPPIFNSEYYTQFLELGDNQTYITNITNTHLSYANFSYNNLNETMTNSSDNFTISFMTFQNGTNTYTVHAYDVVGNENLTSGSFIVQDTIAGPRMTNLEYNATVNQGQNQTIYLWLLNQFPLEEYTVTINETGYDLTNNTFYNFTYTWNTTYCGDTNFTIFANSSDTSYTTTINYSVNLCCGNDVCEGSEDYTNCPSDCDAPAPSTSTSSGGGGGGGGSATTEDPTKRTLLITSATPSTPIEFELDSENIPVNKVEITVEQEVSNIKVSVEALDSRPSSVTIPVGEIYYYLEISTKNLNEQDIEDAEIYFIIEDSWIEENNIDLDTVLLQRYNSGWEQLATEYIKHSGSNNYFKAETDGFSYFAITGEKEITPETTQEDSTEQEITTDAIQEPTQAPEEEQIRETYIKHLLLSLSGIIILLILIIVIIMRVKKWKA